MFFSCFSETLVKYRGFLSVGKELKMNSKEIDIMAQIIAVADAFDTVTTQQKCRKGFAQNLALRELKKKFGSQLNPEIIKTFLNFYRKILP